MVQDELELVQDEPKRMLINTFCLSLMENCIDYLKKYHYADVHTEKDLESKNQLKLEEDIGIEFEAIYSKLVSSRPSKRASRMRKEQYDADLKRFRVSILFSFMHSGKSLNTRRCYLANQKKYLLWAKEDPDIKNTRYPQIVTQERVYSYMKHRATLFENKKGHQESGSSLGSWYNSLADLCEKQELLLKEGQRQVGIPSSPPHLEDIRQSWSPVWNSKIQCPQTKAFTAIRSAKKIADDEKSGLNKSKFHHHRVYDGLKFTKVGINTLIKHRDPNLWFSMCGATAFMIRSGNMRYLDLSDMRIQADEENPHIRALIAVLHRTKTNRSGKPQYTGSYRHINVIRCSHHALAASLFNRFENCGESPLNNLHNLEGWIWRKAFSGTHGSEQSFCPTHHFNLVEKRFREEGVYPPKVLHSFRRFAAEVCEDASISYDQIKHFGHFGHCSDDILRTNDLYRVAPCVLRALAGYDYPGRPPLVMKRDNVKVPKKLKQQIFNFIDPYLDAIENKRLMEFLNEEQYKDGKGKGKGKSSDPIGYDNSRVDDGGVNGVNDVVEIDVVGIDEMDEVDDDIDEVDAIDVVEIDEMDEVDDDIDEVDAIDGSDDEADDAIYTKDKRVEEISDFVDKNLEDVRILDTDASANVAEDGSEENNKDGNEPWWNKTKGKQYRRNEKAQFVLVDKNKDKDNSGLINEAPELSEPVKKKAKVDDTERFLKARAAQVKELVLLLDYLREVFIQDRLFMKRELKNYGTVLEDDNPIYNHALFHSADYAEFEILQEEEIRKDESYEEMRLASLEEVSKEIRASNSKLDTMNTTLNSSVDNSDKMKDEMDKMKDDINKMTNMMGKVIQLLMENQSGRSLAHGGSRMNHEEEERYRRSQQQLITLGNVFHQQNVPVSSTPYYTPEYTPAPESAPESAPAPAPAPPSEIDKVHEMPSFILAKPLKGSKAYYDEYYSGLKGERSLHDQFKCMQDVLSQYKHQHGKVCRDVNCKYLFYLDRVIHYKSARRRKNFVERMGKWCQEYNLDIGTVCYKIDLFVRRNRRAVKVTLEKLLEYPDLGWTRLSTVEGINHNLQDDVLLELYLRNKNKVTTWNFANKRRINEPN